MSRGESNLYGTEIEIRAGFGPEKKWGLLKANFITIQGAIPFLVCNFMSKKM